MSTDSTRPRAQAHPAMRPRTRPQLLVIQPDPLGVPDRFAEWFIEAGLAVRVVQPFAGQTLPPSLNEAGLLVLGGNMSANDDDKYPWLPHIRRLLCQAVDLARPALGICLGSQLLAQTLGGAVTVGDCGLEAGVVQIRWRSEAQTDTLFANLPTPFLAGAMHGDMISTLPDTAVWLAHNDVYPHQAFRVAPYAWGVQFHPEISLETYRAWVSAWDGSDPVALHRLHQGAEDFHRLGDQIAANTRTLATRFADLVHTQTRKYPSPDPMLWER